MTSDPSVEFSPQSNPAPEWHDAGEPLDPNWTAPTAAEYDPPPQIPPIAAPPTQDEDPRPRRWRLAPRSLTGRLVAGVVTLAVVLVLATGIGTYLALRSFLYNRLDQQVESLSTQNATYLASCLSGDRFTCLRTGPPPAQAEWIGIFSPQINGITSTSPQIHPLSLSASMQSKIAAQPSVIRTISADHTTLRIRAVTITGVTIVTGLPTDEVHRTLGRLVILEWAIGAAAIVLAFGVTAYGVRFSLRRLYSVTSTAREVASELSPEGAGLDRRVPVSDPDTEVGQLAESMNTLLSAVETQFAARLAHEEQMRQFLADASHELRTPLTSIRGYAELARMQDEQGTGIDASDNMARIEAEGTRMSRLVDDLLTLARSDQGAAPRTEWIEVGNLIDEAVEGVRAAYPSRRIEVSSAVGLTVIGDRDQLLRVVRNLVTNAAIHTRPDGPIWATAVREGDWAVLRVADAGPGLPPEDAAQVFDRFWRADKSRTRARGGTGLGLAIVASIVQSHGGYVRFDSSVDSGSVVTVAVPLGTE